MFHDFVAGLQDSLNVKFIALFLLKSPVIRKRMRNCLVLNGLIFIGSILVFRCLVSPMLLYLFADSIYDHIPCIVETAYLFLWIIPIYFISFIANTFWYQDIATNAFSIINPEPRPANSNVVDILYRSILHLFYLLQTSLSRLIPIIGPALYLVHVSQLFASTSFEYRHPSLNFRKSASWFYFFGFGAPAAAISFFLPKFLDSGILAVLLPLGILSACAARPGCDLEIFTLSRLAADFCLRGGARLARRRNNFSCETRE